MRLITLNTWGGRAGRKELLGFFEKYKDIDIFCLQEIWSAPYKHLEGYAAGGKEINHDQIMTQGMQEISKALSAHSSYFHPHHLDNYGLQMLVKKELSLIESGDIFVYKSRGYVPEGDVGTHARNIQYVTLAAPEGRISIINFHGLWNGKGKTDTKERIEQSKKIIEFTNKLSNDAILCGDFNLLLNTKSITMFEEVGLRNLIKEYDIPSTRTSFYKKPDKHADYVFVTKGIHVKEFKVLTDEVSDHAPLLLEFKQTA